jgi:hypothetical protein
MHLEEPAVQSDAYIDALLDGHARLPIRLSRASDAPERSVRHVIRLLESGLPRFHPSFLFEERLASQLRAAADEIAPPVVAAQVAPNGQVALDRRLVVGGALASGLSIGAAMLAWRRRQSA